jgi:hypothetical protein
MHTLVQIYYLARKEFERNLTGLTDEDARKRIEPMNCISWIIAHVACQHRSLFVDWPAGRQTDSRYLPYGYGAPPSQPPLEEAMTLWENACTDVDAWLQTATTKSLQGINVELSPEGENWGTLLVRCIFHTWCHLGEISSIRQILGHKPPEFVNMHNWSYEGT